MNESYEEMLINIRKKMKQIAKEFLALHPKIVDGKKKNYAFYNNRFCFRIEDIPEEYRHLYSSGSTSHEPLYYEIDNVRQTKIEDMSKVPEFASKYAEYVELSQTEEELKSQIEQKEKQKKLRQIKQNNNIRQVEQLLNIRMSPTKNTGYFDVNGHIHADTKNTSELAIEECQIKAKLNELFLDGKIDMRTINELQIAVMHLYDSWRKNAPKPVIVSSKTVIQSSATETNDYEERTQEEQQIVVDQKEPSKFESINGETVNKSVEHKPIIGECAKKTEKIHQQKQKLNEMKQQILNAEQNKKYEQELIDNFEEQEEDFGMSM